MRKIGILGGTFNPPHSGHLDIALAVKSEFALDGVVFLPVGNPPHKKTVAVASAEDRIAMLRLLIDGHEGLSVSDMETKRAGYTYTVDTLSELRSGLTDAELFYIIGSDTLFELRNWKNYLKVFSLVRFICVRRPGDTDEKIAREMRFLKSLGADILLSEHTGPDISSTEIRSGNYSFVPENIKQYMEQHHVFE